jgi:hypothetical protein
MVLTGETRPPYGFCQENLRNVPAMPQGAGSALLFAIDGNVWTGDLMGLAGTPDVTVSEHSFPSRRNDRPALVALTVFPVLLVGVVLVAWELAVAELGEAPTPYRHDPASLTALTAALHYVGMALILVSIVVLPASVAFAWFRDRSSTQRMGSFLPLVAWASALAVLWYRWDAVVWFVD